MAFASVGTLGTNNTKTANMSSKVLTTSAQAEAGNLVVVAVAVDNATATDQDEGAVSSVTDSAGGNTWTKGKEFSNSGGAAQGGSVISVWFSKLAVQIPSGGTITANFTSSTSRDAAVISAWEFTVDGSVEIEATNQAAEDQASAPPGSLDATTANIACLRIRAIACEDTGGSGTPTSGWTEMADATTSGGGAASNQELYTEFRISTGTGDASDPTFDSSDQVSVYVALREVSAEPKSRPFKRPMPRFWQRPWVLAFSQTEEIINGPHLHCFICRDSYIRRRRYRFAGNQPGR